MKPILITSGEPAGIGPDICLQLATSDWPLVVLGSRDVLEERARQTKRSLTFCDYQVGEALCPKANVLYVWDRPCPHPVHAGQLDVKNASYVLDMLTLASYHCKQGDFSAVVTAPVHKGIINASGIPFTGHTECFAAYFQSDVVMLLASEEMNVALVTTHLPLADVPKAITSSKIIRVVDVLYHALQTDFAIPTPHIAVSGLNPHAGEGGYLGREEQEVIEPAIQHLKQQGMAIEGPFSADTMFSAAHLRSFDAFVTMYHDQGLPVIKYSSFGHAVNVTLGLPIIRTSVDHGTALELAGTGKANPQSLYTAVKVAERMVRNRSQKHASN